MSQPHWGFHPNRVNAFSQVSVGRALIPVAYQVNEKLTFGATVDFVWGGMDIKMAMPIGAVDGSTPSAGSFMDFMSGHILGEAVPTAGMGQAINDMVGGDMLRARTPSGSDSSLSTSAGCGAVNG